MLYDQVNHMRHTDARHRARGMAISSIRRRVVVVGGGLIGCASAYQLTRAGFDVTLMERDAIASNASRYNAGNLNPLHGTPSFLLSFALEAFHLHEQVRAELARLGCVVPVFPVQRIHLGYEERDRESLEDIAALFDSTAGFSATWLTGVELSSREPRLSPDLRFGVLTEGNLAIDSYEFTRSLALGSEKLGALLLHAAAFGVVASGQRVTGIQTTREVVACDDVVFATGPWVADTRSWLGIDLAVEPVKGELLLMRMEEAPRCDFTWGLTSLYRRRGNQLWVGVTREKCGFDCTPTAKARDSLLDRAARIIPEIRSAEVLEHVAALRPMTPSNAPIAARADGWENVYIANGAGSKGVLYCVGIARMICELLLQTRNKLPQ